LKFAAREWTYRSIDAFDMKQQVRRREGGRKGGRAGVEGGLACVAH